MKTTTTNEGTRVAQFALLDMAGNVFLTASTLEWAKRKQDAFRGVKLTIAELELGEWILLRRHGCRPMSPVYVVRGPQGYLRRRFGWYTSAGLRAGWTASPSEADQFQSATGASIAMVECHLGDDCRFEPYAPQPFVPPSHTDEPGEGEDGADDGAPYDPDDYYALKYAHCPYDEAP